MRKINVGDVPWETFSSPKGKYRGNWQEITLALGYKRHQGLHNGGPPFDLAIEKLAPGETLCPYHDHATQWEMFYILSGTGTVRSSGEHYEVTAGDVILHPPNDAHQIINTGTAELTYVLIADNPPVDICRYPDSNKVGIFDDSVNRRELFRQTEVDYFDGEE